MKKYAVLIVLFFAMATNAASAQKGILALRGVYSSSVTYDLNDVVAFGTPWVYYISIASSNHGNNPTTPSSVWWAPFTTPTLPANATTGGSVLLLAGSSNTTAENAANKGAASGYASLDSGGKLPAGQMPSSIAAIEVRYLAAAICNGGVAYSAALSTYDNQQPQFGCIASATSSAAYMAFQAAASPVQYATTTVATPPYWTGTDVVFSFAGTATTGNVTWIVETGCTNANADVSAPTYGTPISVTTTVSSSAGGLVNSASSANIAVPATNGCTASTTGPSSLVTIRIHRSASDTQTGDARLLGITLTTHRSQ